MATTIINSTRVKPLLFFFAFIRRLIMISSLLQGLILKKYFVVGRLSLD
jgi:hypothetical protein